MCAELSLNFMLKPTIDDGCVITAKENLLPYLFTRVFAGRCKGDVIYCFPCTSHVTPEKEKKKRKTRKEEVLIRQIKNIYT